MACNLRVVTVCLAMALAAGTGVCSGTGTQGKDDGAFAPLEQWKSMVLAGDAAGLKKLYSVAPAARITTEAGEAGADAAIHFWVGLKARRMKIEVQQSAATQADARQIVFQAEVVSAAQKPARTVYISEGQLWQKQDGQWRLVMAKRTEPAHLQQPGKDRKEIYSASADARAEIKEALQHAAKEDKRVILVFGANWCYDCHVLDMAFHRVDLAPILKSNYEVVHIDVGKGEKNQDLMNQYEVPMKRGIPGLAVLESDGKLLYSQHNGEFENARALSPDDLLAFLKQWKPKRR